MELRLDRKEIEAILLAHVNAIVTDTAADFNRVEWDNGYRTLNGATFDHTDIPQEKADE
jgi:hypothetical protein